MFGSRIFPIMCSALFLTSCSGTDLLGSLERATSNLFVPLQIDSGHGGTFIANEDEVYNLQLEAYDVDTPYGDKLIYSIVELPDWLSLSGDGLLKGTPKNAHVGEHEITVRVTDRSGQADDATLLLTVRNTNDNPKFVTASLPRAVQDAVYETQIEVADDDIQHGDIMWFKTANASNAVTEPSPLTSVKRISSLIEEEESPITRPELMLLITSSASNAVTSPSRLVSSARASL